MSPPTRHTENGRISVTAVLSSKFDCDMKSALFWDITQRKVVISYRRFGTTYRFPSKSVIRRTLKIGPDRFSRNFGKKLPINTA
jgi:hypothetical protein